MKHGMKESQEISDTSVDVKYTNKAETCPWACCRVNRGWREVWTVGIYLELWASVFQTGADTSLRTHKLPLAPPATIFCITISGINTQEMRHASWAVMEKHNGTKLSQPPAPMLCTLVASSIKELYLNSLNCVWLTCNLVVYLLRAQ